MRVVLLVLLTCCVPLTGCNPDDPTTVGPNILFFAIDDLRPELGAYGVSAMQTPNIDRLASEGLLFERHYVQFAICIPSRVALLTSLSSERTRQVFGPIRWQQVDGARSLGSTFSAAGYETVSLGKVWHVPPDSLSGDAWDVDWSPRSGVFQTEGSANRLRAVRSETDPAKRARMPKPPIAESLDVPDDAYADGLVADRAVTELQRLARSEKPFFLAVGFYKPHLPFCAPSKYWEQYRRDEIDLAPNPKYPRGMPLVAFNRNPGMSDYAHEEYEPPTPSVPMGDDSARFVRHAYRACVSYADAQVGRVLDELDELGLRENTIVVLWGDHGWHLGDNGMWSKNSNFEAAVRAPLIVSAPGQRARGLETAALVETVDIFPTLLELAGLAPLTVTDGTSFAALLDDPTRSWKTAAFHLFTRGRSINGQHQTVVGHAIRTARFRYVAWRVGWNPDGKLVAEELYDYESDPHETRNVATDSDYAAAKTDLSGQLELMLTRIAHPTGRIRGFRRFGLPGCRSSGTGVFARRCDGLRGSVSVDPSLVRRPVAGSGWATPHLIFRAVTVPGA